MPVIGIDPGASGGVAILYDDGDVRLIEKMPATSSDLAEILRGLDGTVAYLESVHSSPQMGVSSAFKFGKNCGVIEGVLAALQMRVELVTPMKWQKAMGCLAKGRTLAGGDTEKKNANKAAAQRLFPALKVTHAIADALLIAEFGRRIESARKNVA